MAGCSYPPPLPPQEPSTFSLRALGPPRTDAPTRALLLADPQLHHAAGGAIKTFAALPDDVVNVAIRPPQLNLLAPLVLETLVEAGTRTAELDLAIVLGDVGNGGCLTELDGFSGAMHRAAPDLTWIGVHGNHDSFLGGIFHRYSRYGCNDEKGACFPPVHRHCASKVPCLEEKTTHCCMANEYAAWTSHEGECFAYGAAPYESWPQFCAEPSNPRAVPTNKHVWLAHYLRHLSSLGVAIKFSKPSENDEYRVRTITGEGTTGVLGERGFRLSGRWVMPVEGVVDQGRWHSFVVQSIDVAPTKRLILADTSVGGDFDVGTLAVLGGGAGKKARTTEAQWLHIEKHVELAGSSRSVVAASHFPFEDLLEDDQAEWVRLGVREYYSAHTHTPTAIVDHGAVRELNIGSTTDWPMELAVYDFGTWLNRDAVDVVALGAYKSSLRRRRAVEALCPELEYHPGKWDGLFHRHQACAHQETASQMVDYIEGPAENTDLLKSLYVTSGTSTCAQPRVAATSVVEARDALQRVEGDHRLQLLCLAVAASRSEGIQE